MCFGNFIHLENLHDGVAKAVHVQTPALDASGFQVFSVPVPYIFFIKPRKKAYIPLPPPCFHVVKEAKGHQLRMNRNDPAATLVL